MEKLEGKVAAITGGGCGIGRALAAQLAPLGCHMALIDINQGRLDEAAGACARDGLAITTHVADVRDRDRMKALANEVMKAHGGVQILVNNAGVTAWGSFEEMSFEDLDWVLDVNLKGVIHGCKFFLPYLRQQAEAHIVNVSSMFGFAGLPTQGPYCASKAGVRSISETGISRSGSNRFRMSLSHSSSGLRPLRFFSRGRLRDRLRIDGRSAVASRNTSSASRNAACVAGLNVLGASTITYS